MVSVNGLQTLRKEAHQGARSIVKKGIENRSLRPILEIEQEIP
jgi:hypothetical protein